jgi:hypothetical protein
MKTAVSILAVLLAFASAPGAGSQPSVETSSERGVLAVLRRDGLILPFAAFNGNSWKVPWPGPLRFMELPATLEAVPESWWGGWRPGAWEAWLSDGTHRPLEVRSPTVSHMACGTRLSLKTDYQPSLPLPPVPAEPFPKDGLAVAGGARVEPIEIIDRSAAWGALAVALLDDIDRAEDREIGTARQSGWSHPFSKEQRHTVPVRIESWYRAPNGPDRGTVSWIEAVRSYPPGPDDDGCGLETFLSGWVYHDKGEAQPRAELGARLMYCDRVGAAYMLPFGRIIVRAASYWIYQLSGYNSEWYAVAQLGRERVRFVAEYFAGGCR